MTKTYTVLHMCMQVKYLFHSVSLQNMLGKFTKHIATVSNEQLSSEKRRLHDERPVDWAVLRRLKNQAIVLDYFWSQRI